MLEETRPYGHPEKEYPNIECKITDVIEAGDRIRTMYKSKDASERYRIVKGDKARTPYRKVKVL